VVQKANLRRDQLQSEIKDIRKSLEISLNERDQLQSDISSKATETHEATAKDARIKKLQIALVGGQSRWPPLIEKFKQKNDDAIRFELELVAARERIVELEASLETGGTVIGSVCDPEELTDGRDASNDAVDDQYSVAGSENADEPEFEVDEEIDVDEEDGSDSPTNDTRDDLKAIKGVGPAIEKTLNELGIRRFHQIADMSEYDIDRIAKHLKGFRSRIYREDWIGQARDLGDQDSGD
jgi:predicted flap endonuclease-1-like 5' DNA nuclease